MKSDREKWDSKYSRDMSDLLYPDPLLIEYKTLLSSGRALDVASGLGSNSIFLARCGYWVDAMDTSLVAARKLKEQCERQGLSIAPIVVDLDYFPLPVRVYDVVAVFYFFSISLLESIRSALKPGGILFYSTYNYRHICERPGFCREYLVPPGGIGHFFYDLESVIDREQSPENPAISQFIGINSR